MSVDGVLLNRGGRIPPTNPGLLILESDLWLPVLDAPEDHWW